MALQEPFAAYNAANPYEATLLCQALNTADIEAHVIDDVSQVGVWLGGLVPELNKTQIWIERADADRARVVLEEYERRAAELNELRTGADAGLPPIDVPCDACGFVTRFGAHLKGSVQSCEKCGAYLDVGETAEDSGDWAVESQDAQEAATNGEDTADEVADTP